jgi:NAD(P)-dependent dehydrogenase (short-subunit alcohol dehydrogenase family)
MSTHGWKDDSMRPFVETSGSAAVITCAGSGIGRASAISLAARGARVVGELVADAVTDGRFLVLTAPAVHDELVERTADIDSYLASLAEQER